MFDPSLPQENTPVDAVQMRGQLNGLKALIDALGSVTGATVDAVNSLPPGSPATVSVTLTGTTLHFTFGIPEGQTGPQGIPGEVTQTALDAAISGTSSNSNGVSLLSQSAFSYYDQTQMQDVLNKVDELITALRRP
ncbi:MAG: hypothetical protein HS117_00285 [Verrucomicrobiaceae bacterium]|nr:hypothetical protein [Verrucomicrobiaceae bacterium]